MGYRIENRTNGWRLVHRVDRGKLGRETRHVSKTSQEARELGLREEMDKATAKRIMEAHYSDQKRKSLIDKEARKIAKIEGRLNKERLYKSSLLPEDIVNEFEVQIFPEENLHIRHWECAQELICQINIEPSEWGFRKKSIWNYFLEKGYSIDYSRRILRAVNLYMMLYCRRLNKFWAPIPNPDGTFKVSMRLKNRTKRNGKQEPKPLTINHLANAKGKMHEEEFNWIETSLYFGLRVEEMNQLTKENFPGLWYVQKDDQRFSDGVLWVLQMKLVRVDGMEPEKAWKAIPATEPEQIRLISLIEAGKLKEPLLKTVKKFAGPELQKKSGRTGFVEWICSRGYSELIASKWLGHKSIVTTRNHYEQNKIAYWETPTKKKD